VATELQGWTPTSKQEKTTMIRKLVIATAAIAALSAASLTMSTTAEAKKGGWKGHHGHGHLHRHLRFGHSFTYFDGCLRQVWRINRFGEAVLRTVDVCD
jgi:hypothetical protein